MKDFIKAMLLEAFKTGHWAKESYPNRIIDSTLKDMDPKHKGVIDQRLKFIESLEFSEGTPQKIGIWVYKTPKEVLYPPFERRDKGHLLLAIINNNAMTTLYWKHKVEGQYDYDISYEKLVEFSNSEFYDAKTKPITLKSLMAWSRPKQETPQVNTTKFKKIKLSDDTTVRYYKALNKFATLDGEEIKLDVIFDKLPEELQSKIMELL